MCPLSEKKMLRVPLRLEEDESILRMRSRRNMSSESGLGKDMPESEALDDKLPEEETPETKQTEKEKDKKSKKNKKKKKKKNKKKNKKGSAEGSEIEESSDSDADDSRIGASKDGTGKGGAPPGNLPPSKPKIELAPLKGLPLLKNFQSPGALSSRRELLTGRGKPRSPAAGDSGNGDPQWHVTFTPAKPQQTVRQWYNTLRSSSQSHMQPLALPPQNSHLGPTASLFNEVAAVGSARNGNFPQQEVLDTLRRVEEEERAMFNEPVVTPIRSARSRRSPRRPSPRKGGAPPSPSYSFL